MADKIIHKKSFQDGSVPTTASLELAELAINVADGKAYIRRSGSVGDYVVPIVTAGTVTTGSIQATSGFTGSLFGTASWAVNAQTASYVLPLNQDVLISGSLKFDPTQDPDPLGLDLDASVLFQSASNTALGYDLYIRQNGNLVKWKWVEGILNTGLLYGGVVTYSGSDVFVSPGSGIIVDHNATTGSEISPIVEYVTWSAITQSITNIATQQVTYLYIDNTGTLQQQSTRFTNEQYHDYIPLGAAGHFDYTQVSAFGGQVQTAYDQVGQISSFVDAFGPLKVSGYGITGQPGTLRLSIGSGISFIHGGFYENDPELPSQITTPAQATASLARVYRSGSSVIFDTNAGNLYTTVDPTVYDRDGDGTLANVGNGNWSIQRVFSDPKTGVLYVYYGQERYTTLLNALQYLPTDPFTEGDTFDFTTFVGYLVLRGNASNITDTNNNSIINGGLFRGSGQGSSGGVAISNLDDLTDVSITGPTNGEALIYDSGIWRNGIPLTATSASFALSGNGAFSGSFSGTSSWADNAVTASFITASNVFGTVTSAALAATASYYAETDPIFTAVSGTFATTSSFNAFTASYTTGSFTGSFIGDGSQLTGIVSSKWTGSGTITRESDVEITGSLTVTGSLNTFGNMVIQGSGSSIPLLLVTGSTGQLFSIIDQDDIVDFPLIVSGTAGQLLSVNSTGDIYYGINTAILLSRQQTLNSTGSFITLYSIQTGSYTSAFVNYTVASGSNAKSGQLMSVWYDSTASWAEVTTTHIGNASQIRFEVTLSGSNALINVSSSATTDWLVKTSLNIL